jgi:hypothetical protein
MVWSNPHEPRPNSSLSNGQSVRWGPIEDDTWCKSLYRNFVPPDTYFTCALFKSFFASYFCVICKARTLTALLCVQGRRAAWHYNRYIINYFTVTAIDEYWLSLHKNSNVKLLFVSVKIIWQTETRDVCRREIDSNSNNDVTNTISCQKCRVRNNCWSEALYSRKTMNILPKKRWVVKIFLMFRN